MSEERKTEGEVTYLVEETALEGELEEEEEDLLLFLTASLLCSTGSLQHTGLQAGYGLLLGLLTLEEESHSVTSDVRDVMRRFLVAGLLNITRSSASNSLYWATSFAGIEYKTSDFFNNQLQNLI